MGCIGRILMAGTGVAFLTLLGLITWMCGQMIFSVFPPNAPPADPGPRWWVEVQVDGQAPGTVCVLEGGMENGPRVRCAEKNRPAAP